MRKNIRRVSRYPTIRWPTSIYLDTRSTVIGITQFHQTEQLVRNKKVYDLFMDMPLVPLPAITTVYTRSRRHWLQRMPSGQLLTGPLEHMGDQVSAGSALQ